MHVFILLSSSYTLVWAAFYSPSERVGGALYSLILSRLNYIRVDISAESCESSPQTWWSSLLSALSHQSCPKKSHPWSHLLPSGRRWSETTCLPAAPRPVYFRSKRPSWCRSLPLFLCSFCQPIARVGRQVVTPGFKAQTRCSSSMCPGIIYHPYE
jgi:hypothetical protein